MKQVKIGEERETGSAVVSQSGSRGVVAEDKLSNED